MEQKIDIRKVEGELEIVPAKNIEDVKCEEVSEDEIEWLIKFGEKLVAKCALSGGAGLSACQVGIKKKVFAWMFKESLFQLAVNPRYFRDERKVVNVMEGCLSYPGQTYFVTRYKYIRAVYYTINRETKKFIKIMKRLRDESAIIYQHECDHCNGITIATTGKLLDSPKK